MRFTVAAILFSFLITSASFAGKSSTLDHEVWHQELQKAHVIAKSQSKPMLIVFGATWCKFCTKLEKETLSQPEMQSFIKEKFVPIHLDLDEQRAVGKILEVKSLPCTVVLSPNADLLGKVVGFKDVKTMRSELDKALETQNVIRQAAKDGKTVR